METEEERVAAMLHDVVEDADYTLSEIETTFDTETQSTVAALTKHDGEAYMESIDRVDTHPTARRVKIADLKDNLDTTRLEKLTDDIQVALN